MILITFRGKNRSLSLLDRMLLMSPMLRLMIQLRVVTRLTSRVMTGQRAVKTGMLVKRSLVMSPMMAPAKALDGAFAARIELVHLYHGIVCFWWFSSGDRFWVLLRGLFVSFWQ